MNSRLMKRNLKNIEEDKVMTKRLPNLNSILDFAV